MMSLIQQYAPVDPSQPCNSHHLQRLFTQSARKFCPKEEKSNWKFYSTRRPDIVITYTWGMDLLHELPRFIRRLWRHLRRQKLVTSWEDFAGKTLWLDILFNDQNSKVITQDLNDAQEIYEKAWLHAVFVMRNPLSRGWCLFEIGV